jgi:transcriptional regulator with XRE-family HTH domain
MELTVMAIAERIKFFRILRGMTQKYLGMAVGFDERTADVRMAQYESGTRTPKENLAATLAGVLGISPLALSVPDIDSDMGLAHTLFALEDLYGLGINKVDGELCLTLDRDKGSAYHSMWNLFNAWQQERGKLTNGEITKEEYDQWRYQYPTHDTTQVWGKVPSKELSDYLVKRLGKKRTN